MREISLHIMDIAENSVSAGARNIEITVDEDPANNRIRIVIEDDGKGMDARMLAGLADPFVTTRTTRIAGLGIPFLKAAAEACNGTLDVSSQPGQGTRIRVEFERDHIDRMPLGDLPGTMLALVVGFPETRWVFHYRVADKEFTFDDKPLKRALDDIPLSEPSVLRYIRETLQEGVCGVRRAARSPSAAPQGG